MGILEKIYHQHDVVCNQKYDNYLPYSFHLKAVVTQARKYSKYLPTSFTSPMAAFYDLSIKEVKVIVAAAGHELIEDARMTYNDVSAILGEEVANIIYCCTEEKGKNREERHSQKFFDELKLNRLAVFVKLCDIMANVLYSLLTNSSMYEKYQKEFDNLKEQLYIKGEYDLIWNDLEKILN